MNTPPDSLRRGAARRRLSVLLIATLAAASGAPRPADAQRTDTARPAPIIPAAEAQRDLRILERAFNDLHPGLLRYTDPATLAAEFNAARESVAGGATTARMYLLATRLAAAVRCGHTWTNVHNQPPAVREAVFDSADKLPLTLRFVDGRMLVTGSAAPGVAPGAELLAIDGRSGGEIQRALLPYLRADGSSDGKRLSQLDHGRNGGAMDRLFPLLFAPADAGYTLRLRHRGDSTTRDLRVPATTAAARDRAIAAPPPANEWTLAIDGDTAVLTLPTFAYWDGRFDARAFIARSFATLAGRRVQYLIIDNRPNEGGDDALGHALLAALIRDTHVLPAFRRESAYERVPYILARYLETWDFGFFDRTGQVTRKEGADARPDSRPDTRNWRLPDAPPRPIVPAGTPGTPFAGRVILLVGPQNSSAGHLIADAMKASGAALLIGQPTGGNQRGLNGGQLAWLTLPASKVAVDIPLIAGFALHDAPDAGVMPDLLVPPSFDDAAAGIDTEMVAARARIARWRAGR